MLLEPGHSVRHHPGRGVRAKAMDDQERQLAEAGGTEDLSVGGVKTRPSFVVCPDELPEGVHSEPGYQWAKSPFRSDLGSFPTGAPVAAGRSAAANFRGGVCQAQSFVGRKLADCETSRAELCCGW